MSKYLHLEQLTGFKFVVVLTFDLKVISAILSLHFNHHIISNYCAKYKHTSSMHERGVCILISVTDFKNIFDFDP